MSRLSKGQKAEKRLRKNFLIAAAVLLLIGVPAFRYGPRLYARWDQNRTVAESRVLMKKGDIVHAVEGLRKVVLANSSHLDALRLMAEIADGVGNPEAVRLHERVCSLAPDSFEDAYAWATASQRFGDRPRAQEAMTIMKRTGPKRPEYLVSLARFQRDAGKYAEASGLFHQAVLADPKNDLILLEVSVLDLLAPSTTLQEQARQNLEQLRSVPRCRMDALRSLAAYEGQHARLERTIELTKELANDPAARFSDRLLYLSALHAGRHPDFAGYLTSLQERAADKPAEILQLLNWTNSHNLAMLSREWSRTLSPAMIESPIVTPKIAETYTVLRDWNGLKEFASTSWNDYEYLRFAFLARAIEELDDTSTAEAEWKAAITAVSQNPDRLNELVGLADAWGWSARSEALLWYIAQSSKRPHAALQKLAARYGKSRDTRNLNRAFASLVEVTPNDVAIKNNWVMTSLLMRIDLPRAADAAKELYDAHPDDASLAATYAFALYSTNRTDDALEVLRKLPPDKLQRPSIAAYYGIMLTALRDPEAAKYLALAKGNKFLPEEEQLIAKAERTLKGEVQ